MDDGSHVDSSAEYDVYKKDNRVRVIHKTNGGVSSARNLGMKKACGEWILFVDSDDWLETDTLEKLYGLLNNYSKCDVIQFSAYRNFATSVCKMTMSYTDSYIYDMNITENKLYIYRALLQPANFLKKSIAASTTYYIWDKIFKHSFLEKNKITFDERIRVSEDKLFCLHCAMQMKNFVYADIPLYHYRLNDASVTNKYAETIDRDRILLFSILKGQIDKMCLQLTSLGVSKNKVRLLNEDFRYFIQMSVSGVLERKFYHKDWPYRKQERELKANEFMCSKYVKEVFERVHYNDYTLKNTVRIFMLKHSMFRLHAFVRFLFVKLKTKKAEHVIVKH